jgi:hypothetical protein
MVTQQRAGVAFLAVASGLDAGAGQAHWRDLCRKTRPVNASEGQLISHRRPGPAASRLDRGGVSLQR